MMKTKNLFKIQTDQKGKLFPISLYRELTDQETEILESIFNELSNQQDDFNIKLINLKSEYKQD